MKFIEVTAPRGNEFGIGRDGQKGPKKSGTIGLVVHGNSGPVSMGGVIFKKVIRGQVKSVISKQNSRGPWGHESQESVRVS